MKKHLKNKKPSKLRDELTGFVERLRNAAGLQPERVPVLVPIPAGKKAVWRSSRFR